VRRVLAVVEGGIRLCWRPLTVLGCFLALNAAAADPDAWHKNLEESGRKSQAARSIEQRYVKTLGLQGKSVAQAIEILLSEGFRCGLRAPDDAFIFKEQSRRVRCAQDQSKIDAACPTLVLVLEAHWSGAADNRAQLLAQIGSAEVMSVGAMCPISVAGSPEFAAHKKRAEDALQLQVDQLALVGTTAKRAFDRLLTEGYECGIGTVDDTDSSLDANLTCRRLPTHIQWCFDAELQVSLRWKQPHGSLQEQVRGIQTATVLSVKSQCRLPPMEGDQRV
jgi:hypothetical protein